MNISVPSQVPGQSSLPTEILLHDNGVPVTGYTRLGVDRSPRRSHGRPSSHPAHAYGRVYRESLAGVGDIIPAFQSHGLGYAQTVCDPFGGNCQDVNVPDLTQTVEYPSINYSASPDWTSIINGTTRGVVDVIAITQGGAITPSGAVYGNPAAATVAAGTPAAALNIGSGGASAMISPTMLLLGVGVLALVMMKR